MTPAEIITILQEYSNWRKGGDDWPPSPNKTIEAIDAAIAMIERMEKQGPEKAFVKALTYYQNKLKEVEGAHAQLKGLVDSFVENFVEDDEE